MDVNLDIKEMNGFCLKQLRYFFLQDDEVCVEGFAGVDAGIISRLGELPDANFRRLLESSVPVFTLQSADDTETWVKKFAAIKK